MLERGPARSGFYDVIVGHISNKCNTTKLAWALKKSDKNKAAPTAQLANHGVK